MCTKIESKQLYLNLESGFLIGTRFQEPLKLAGCVGRRVEYDIVEFDHVTIEGSYYQIVGWYGDLAQLRRVN